MLVHRGDGDLYSITVLTPIFDLRDVVKNEEQCQCKGSFVCACACVFRCDVLRRLQWRSVGERKLRLIE